MAAFGKRLAALRDALRTLGLDGFIAPRTDEHLSEYIGVYAERVAWLSGFRGTAGTAIVLPDTAALFIDGRYTLQVRNQTDPAHWSYYPVPETDIATWLADAAPEGGRIGYDPWLHKPAWIGRVRQALEAKGCSLVPVAANPIDALWSDQPEPSRAPLRVYPDSYAGGSSIEKRGAIAAGLRDQGIDALVLAMLDSVAWIFNIRGNDVAYIPVALSYALVRSDGGADLFVEPEKMTSAVRDHLGETVRIFDKADFVTALDGLSGKRVSADPDRTVVAIFERLEAAGAIVVPAPDPVVMPKALKNEVERAGFRAAHERDGVALTRFLHWISEEAPKGHLTELSASDHLDRLRFEGGAEDLSFKPISASGPNGAIQHYQPTEETSQPIALDTLYLVDSGGQYFDGTTDVTRTVAIGTPSDEMRRCFTAALKGHIALAKSVFPAGTTGAQLDTVARQHLWAAGLDYNSGTGHGVGTYLSVHEGPHVIAKATMGYPGVLEPLRPGMIVSNEPGYYKTGAFGIRTENLMFVEERSMPGAKGPLLGFETLTLAPIDRNLIVEDMLDRDERGWLNDYHRRVLEQIGGLVPPQTRAWLEEVTAPIG
jgi:Xaa-Pro aminopeptidase